MMSSILLILSTLCLCYSSTAFLQKSNVHRPFALLREFSSHHHPPSLRRASTTDTMEVGWTMETTEDVRKLLIRAKNCAYSDDDTDGELSCSVEDASELLQDLTFLLS